jgi:hypothetical protein
MRGDTFNLINVNTVYVKLLMIELALKSVILQQHVILKT